MSEPAPDPAGQEWVIRRAGPGGVHEARIMSVGATVRSYEIDGRPVLSGFARDEKCPAYRGGQLMPWPNRVGDGCYRYEGVERQLALTEPERANAMHGLLCWQEWRAVRHDEDTLTAQTTLRPQQGWDWTLTCRITYALDEHGLRVTPWVRNESASTAPFGYGVHPYLTCGEESVDDLHVRVPATHVLLVDPDRLLPTDPATDRGLGAVPDGLDLRAGPPLRGRAVDTAYTRLEADPDGCWRVHLQHESTGRTTTLWAPIADFGWVQVFSGDSLPEPVRRRSGVAVEPMTCGPDALRTGHDLIHLRPGDEWSATWGLTSS